MPEPNPNRDLPADQVVALFRENLPHLLPGLGADRDWLWFSSPEKPDERTRALLKQMGFEYTERDHTLADGRTARWYHACGTAVFRRRKGAKPARSVSTRQQSAVDKSSRRPARSGTRSGAQPVDDSVAALARLAAALP